LIGDQVRSGELVEIVKLISIGVTRLRVSAFPWMATLSGLSSMTDSGDAWTLSLIYRIKVVS
jgi:hypothetical protein